jgi:hypothetical protein
VGETAFRKMASQKGMLPSAIPARKSAARRLSPEGADRIRDKPKTSAGTVNARMNAQV